MDGSAKMSFLPRVAWISTQQDCADLRWTHSHLTQRTHPSEKATNIPDIKRYSQKVTMLHDGLLVVCDQQPFQPKWERHVVPRSVLHGLLTALNFPVSHPSKYQTKRLFSRYFKFCSGPWKHYWWYNIILSSLPIQYQFKPLAASKHHLTTPSCWLISCIGRSEKAPPVHICTMWDCVIIYAHNAHQQWTPGYPSGSHPYTHLWDGKPTI